MFYLFQTSFDMLLECFHKNGEQLNWVKEILFKIQSWKVTIGLQNFSWDGAYVNWKADDEMLGGAMILNNPIPTVKHLLSGTLSQ